MKEGPVRFSYTASFVRLSVLASIVTLFALAIAAVLQKPGSVGQFSTCCLALASLAGWWHLRTVGRTVVVLTDTGLTDHRWTSKEIPWPVFTGIGIHQAPGWNVVTLDVDPAQPGLTRWIRMTLRIRAWLGLGANGLWVSTHGLDVDLQTLYATIDSRMRRARPASNR